VYFGYPQEAYYSEGLLLLLGISLWLKSSMHSQHPLGLQPPLTWTAFERFIHMDDSVVST